MNMRRLPFVLLALMLGAAHADTLYKCTDAEGHTTYTNQKGGAKSCIVISRELPVSSMPAPKARANAPTPGDFPRVGAGEQKARDGDRRAILEQEFANEQKNLDESRKNLAAQEAAIKPEERNAPQATERLKPYRDTVALHERNVEALKKEIGNLK